MAIGPCRFDSYTSWRGPPVGCFCHWPRPQRPWPLGLVSVACCSQSALDGHPRISMDAYGSFLDIHGYPWKSIDIHRYPWTMDSPGYLRSSTEHQTPYNPGGGLTYNRGLPHYNPGWRPIKCPGALGRQQSFDCPTWNYFRGGRYWFSILQWFTLIFCDFRWLSRFSYY